MLVYQSHKLGAIGESAVQLECSKRGYLYCKPNIPARYDMIIDTGHKIIKAQVKSVLAKTQKKQSAKTKYYNIKIKTSPYTEKEIDCILVYIVDKDKVLHLNIKNFLNRKTICINENHLDKYEWR